MTFHMLSEHCFNHESKFRIYGFINFISPTVFFGIRDPVQHNFEMDGLFFNLYM